MEESVALDKFRETGNCNHTSKFSFCAATKSFVAGDALGNVNILDNPIVMIPHTIADNSIQVIAHPSGQVCAVSSEKFVNLHHYPNVDEECRKAVIRKTLPITDFAFDKQGKYLIATSSEPDINIIGLDSDDWTTDLETKIKTMDVGVKVFAVNSDLKYLAYIDENNKFYILSLKMGSGSITYDIEHRISDITSKYIIKDNNQICRLSWHPSYEGLVVVPGTQGCISMISYDELTNSWKEDFLLPSIHATLSHHEADLIMTIFSPCGRFLASLDIQGTVLIWMQTSVETKYEPRQKLNATDSNGLKAIVTDICWGSYDEKNQHISLLLSSLTDCAIYPVPVNKLRHISTTESHDTHIVREKTSSTTPVKSPAKVILSSPMKEKSPVTVHTGSMKSPPKSSTEKTDKLKRLKKSVTATATATASASDDISSDKIATNNTGDKSITTNKKNTDDDDDDDIFMKDIEYDGSISAIKNAIAGPPTTATTGTDSNANNTADTKMLATSHFDDDDDDIDQDIEPYSSLIDPKSYRHHPSATTALSTLNIEALVKYHPRIHISSTKPDEKLRRYLVWNAVGNITSREETANNRIEIRFANTGGRNKNEVFADNFGFTMATMSLEGALFASDPVDNPRDDVDTLISGSTLYYHAFPGTGKLEGCNDSFTMNLNDKEAVTQVAVGCGWCAVSTNRNWLRILSSTGVQLGLHWINGPVVCLCGSEEYLVVIYNTSHTMNSNYHLEVQIFHIPPLMNKVTPIGSYPVPLSEGSTLEWVCLSADTQSLHIIDSKSIMSMLQLSGNNSYAWMPVLDIDKVKKSVDHKYWPVMIRGNKLAYVLLNGENKPNIYPQPVISTRPFSVPIISVKETKDQKGDGPNETASRYILDTLMTSYYEDKLQTSSVSDPSQVEVYESKLQLQEQEIDRTMLKMFQEACRYQRTQQALDLSYRLRTDVALSAAIKVANHFGRNQIAAKIDTLRQQRQLMRDDSMMIENTNSAMSHAYSMSGGTANSSHNTMSNTYHESETVYDFSTENETSSTYNTYHTTNTSTPASAGRSGNAGKAIIESSGSLSRKANSNKLVTPYSNRDTAVTTTHYSPSSITAPASPRVPLNPFERSAVTSPVKKRTSLLDLKSSPSPKRPMLARESPFAKQARQSKMNDKRIL